VSSYGRNTFTRGVPCLRLVRSPLYTFAAATCHSAPHLRYRSSLGPCSGRVVPLRTSRPCRLQPRPEVFSTRGTPGSFGPSAPKHDRPYLRHRRSALLRWAAPAPQNSHNSSSISASVKPALRKLPRVAEAAHEPKTSAWLDVDRASEGHFPQQKAPPTLSKKEHKPYQRRSK
jgi:hypothetical protein